MKIASMIRYWKRKKLKKKFSSCGPNFRIEPGFDIVGHSNISFGDHVYIGPRCLIYSTGAKLVIGNHFISGPNLTVITGDHRIDIIGKFIGEVEAKEKLPENDMDVIIDDDVWCGVNVTILKGVHIGKGAVVAAGSVVTKDVPPYSIVGGVPAKILKMRFSEEQIKEHEKLLLDK